MIVVVVLLVVVVIAGGMYFMRAKQNDQTVQETARRGEGVGRAMVESSQRRVGDQAPLRRPGMPGMP